MTDNKKVRGAVLELKQALMSYYGNRLNRMIVFGSTAKKTRDLDSDIDVLIVLNETSEINWIENFNIRKIVLPIELKHDVVFDLKFNNRSIFKKNAANSPFLEKILVEGVTV